MSVVSAPSDKPIELRVTRVQPGKGKVYAAIFEQAEGYPKAAEKAIRQLVHPGKQEVARWVLVGLEPGRRYAVVTFQDRNDNGQMDFNWLGVPQEAYGYSNRSGVLAMPKFDKDAREMRPGEVIEVELTGHPR